MAPRQWHRRHFRRRNGVGENSSNVLPLPVVHALRFARIGYDSNSRLSLFAHLRESGVQGPFLVICPLSVLAPWMNEIAHWVPSFKAIRFHGTTTERERLKAVCKEKEYDVYVTTYEQFVLERNWFSHRVWRYVVVDEGNSTWKTREFIV